MSTRDELRRTQTRHRRQERKRPTPPTSPERVQKRADLVSTHAVRAVDAARTDLFATMTRTGDDRVPKTVALNIATAQRVVLADMQHDIAMLTEVVLRDSVKSVDIKTLGRSVKEYCRSSPSVHDHGRSRLISGLTGNALRDLEYMQDCAARFPDDERDPFYLKSSKTLQRQSMEDAGMIPRYQMPKGKLPRTRDDPQHPWLPGLARGVAIEQAYSEQLIVRFLMATVGGLALIIPMLVMTYFPGKNVSVVTTSAAMLIFAAVITLGTQLAPDQVLGATAAYAAVLVVFVGTSLTI